MPSKTKIEWADYISNPIKARRLDNGKQGHACVKISEGCAHCWAGNFNIRLGTGFGYTQPNLGKVEPFLDEKELVRINKFKPRGPFKWGRSRAVVFPCDMTDLFGDWVPNYWINRLIQLFALRQDVDWLILTKRPERMYEIFADRRDSVTNMPCSNIYLGCSVENNKRANERRDPMEKLSFMGWNTWVSYEPALEVVNWNGWDFLNGLICGGESGVLARPMPAEAPREARNFCEEHGIPFFFKQWGEWLPIDHLAWVNDETRFKHKPVDVNGTMMVKVGKGLAGNVLDGMYHLKMAGE